jgi:hypothetical protein
MNLQLDNAKQTAKKFAVRTLWIALITALVAFAGYYMWRSYTVSEGSRSGILVKISKKGYIFKTFEGQIQLAGMQMMTPESTWLFSAKNEAVYLQLQNLEGKMVKCYYRQVEDAFPWQGDTDYIVDKIEAITQ